MEAIDSGRLIPVSIEDEMKSSFLEYSMSVIVSRALPDVRDGLKPVHRRILYAMSKMGAVHNKPYSKSARTVGEVIGKYHPHGDVAVYDSLVRMAQNFSLRYPFIDGQGNFGSVDGDSPAAMRYTEARLSRIASEMLEDLDKETVDFVPNYDEKETEPTVLPGKIPNLLVNGSSGIAVGMATNIPPHNFTETINGVIHLIENPDCSIDDLMTHIPGPDFPTAGQIHGQAGIRSAYHTGRGLVTMRATAIIEPMGKGDRERIVISEIPYQVNKSRLVEKIAELTRDKRIVGISDIRDESDRRGMQVVVELKKDAIGQVVLNQLYKHTQMQDTFGVILLALVNGQPRLLTLKEMLSYFVDHRIEIVTRRTLYDLRKAGEREHVLLGYVTALDNLDAVIKLIRNATSPDTAKTELMVSFPLTEIQAKAILELRLQRLTGMERQKIENELAEIKKTIKELEYIRDHEEKKLSIIKEELILLKDKYGDARRTELLALESEVDIEDLIADEEMVVTVSTQGYIKRNPITVFRSQRRGGRGVRGLSMKEEDVVSKIFIASTHSHLLFFTTQGRVFRKKVYEIPEAGRTAKGKAMVNLIQLKPDEKVATVFPLKEFAEESYLVIATRKGYIKKSKLSLYSRIHVGGIIAIDLTKDDAVISAKVTDGKKRVLLSSKNGMSILFSESDLRPMGRVARGVRGVRLDKGDCVVAMAVFSKAPMEDEIIFTIKENGMGKLTAIEKYPEQKRGGKGVIDIKTDDGKVVSVRKVTPLDDLMIITTDGVVIRIKSSDISVIGRNTKGVRIISVGDSAKVASVGRFAEPKEPVDDETGMATEPDIAPGADD